MPDVPGVSADIQRLIHACLALNPEDRPTAEQLALSARQKQFPIKSRKPLYITLVVIALLLVGGLSFFLGGNNCWGLRLTSNICRVPIATATRP